MIIDSIANAEIYTKSDEKLKKAFDFIKKYNENPLETGRYEIDGDNMFVLIMDVELKAEGRLEAHDRYIDLQYICEGSETMRICARHLLEVEEDCLEEKDFIFFKPYKDANEYRFNTGDFAVFYPGDAHEPGLFCGDSKASKKVVVKIKI